MPSIQKRAVITGVTGQDGSYLSELLLERDYEVWGVMRPGSSRWQIEHLQNRLRLIEEDLSDPDAFHRVIQLTRPHEIYHLAAVSSIGASHAQPALTDSVNARAVSLALTAIRELDPRIRFCQASSSEIFGLPLEVPQHENTPLNPRNPYGVAKAAAHGAVVAARETCGLYAASAILFNHESPRRGLEFVTRKVTDGVARIKLGLAHELSISNLEARRDWGYAKDYVRALWLMLCQNEPRDFVIATGETHSVRELIEIAFGHVGLDWRDYVAHNAALARPAEPTEVVGDATAARRLLGWCPTVRFEELVRMMVDADLRRLASPEPNE